MSSYVQKGFEGGMNILVNDTALKQNEYRLCLNARSRFGRFSPVANGIEDVAAPIGVKQDIQTFGDFVVLFVAGYCYYRLFSATGWKQIPGFKMSIDAPRFWTAIVPVTTLLFNRLATSTDAKAAILWNNVAGANQGTPSGIVVQDNINQPQIVYIDPVTLLPTARVLQTYAQWTFATNKREYVPIGNAMAWVDGVLYVTSQDFETIYRSVSGRPIDFVINITAAGDKGGDASTTSYSVGVGGITCLRPISSNALFVAASNANFAVSKNMTQGADKIFGEYTFIRTFLFNAVCLSDRAIIDSLGDTRFIDITGIRSFNAVEYLQNQGRNSPFSLLVQNVFDGKTQLPLSSAAILYDNYEFYAVDTTFGPAIAIYDTINNCWDSFDTEQTNGSLIKMFAKIELTIQRLYAITVDNKIYTLHSGTEYAPIVRTLSISPDTLRLNGEVIPPNWEHKLQNMTLLFQNVTEDFTASITPIVQNELTATGTMSKDVKFNVPSETYTGKGILDDMNKNIKDLFFATPDCAQGQQTYALIAWTSGAELQQFGFEVTDISTPNPLRSQS